MGSGGLGLSALRSIVDSGHEVGLVVTPDEARANPDGMPYPSVAAYARRRGLQIARSEGNVRDETVQTNALLKPDIVISANWRRLIPRSVLDHARFGGFNVHRSLLPAYGGLDPINWAVVNGETESGVTIHVLDDRIDFGDIVLQRRFSIGVSETGFDVHRKSLRLVAEMVPEVLQRLESGTVARTAQDPAKLTMFPRRSEHDNRIDWRAGNVEIYNLIRAQADPFPNAHSSIGGVKLRIKSASLATGSFQGRAGTIVDRSSSGVVVLCGDDDGAARSGLIVHEVQEVSGKPIDARDYFVEKNDSFDRE